METAKPNLMTRLVSWMKTPGFQKYSKNAAWFVFGRGISLVVSFFVTVYVARYLGPTNYGTLSYAVGFIALFSFLANLGIDQIIYRELVKYPERESRLLGSALFIKLIAGLLTYAIVAVCTFSIDKDWFVSSLILIVGLSFFFQPFQIINFYFQSKVEARKITITQLWVMLILSGLKVLFVILHLGIYYFSAIFLLEAIFYAIFYILIYQKVSNIFKWKFDKETILVILGDSWPYMIATAFAVVYTRIDQIMIKHIIDTTSVGIYDAGVRIAEVWYFVPGAIITSLFPAIINSKIANDGSYEKRLLRFFAVILLISLLFALPIHFLSDKIISLLFGIKYLGAGGILSIYVWGGIGYSLSVALTQYLSAENHRTAIFISSFFGMIINVALNIVWIPQYGIYGAAWATLIAYSVMPFSLLISKPIRVHMKKILLSHWR